MVKGEPCHIGSNLILLVRMCYLCCFFFFCIIGSYFAVCAVIAVSRYSGMFYGSVIVAFLNNKNF